MVGGLQVRVVPARCSIRGASRWSVRRFARGRGVGRCAVAIGDGAEAREVF